jgi:hypothetical protein
MPARFEIFAVVVVFVVAPAGAFCQVADEPLKDDPSVLRAPLLDAEVFTATRVGADGTIVLELARKALPERRDRFGWMFAEGYYLLVNGGTQPTGKRSVLRALVIDIASGLVLTVKTGAEASAKIQVNDAAWLVRPLFATTATLRALPEEIPFGEKPVGPNAGAVARESGALAASRNNLKQIGLAIHKFQSDFNRYPRAVIYGPDGKPWHSWRVLILPFLEQAATFKAYDLNQPWDSPKNKLPLEKMPAVYRDPIHGETKEPHTHYAALLSPLGIFRPGRANQNDMKLSRLVQGGVGIAQVADGTVNTLMVSSVEPGRKIPWTKPEDIDAGPAFAGFGRPGGIAAPYKFPGRQGGMAAPFLFADGRVDVISTTINPRTLSALISCSGGEIIDSNSLPRHSEPNPDAKARLLEIHLEGGKATWTIE